MTHGEARHLHVVVRLFFLEGPHALGAVRVQNAVQMVDLVLEDARQPALSAQAHGRPAAVEALDRDLGEAFHLAGVTRHRQAALGQARG